MERQTGLLTNDEPCLLAFLVDLRRRKPGCIQMVIDVIALVHS